MLSFVFTEDAFRVDRPEDVLTVPEEELKAAFRSDRYRALRRPHSCRRRTEGCVQERPVQGAVSARFLYCRKGGEPEPIFFAIAVKAFSEGTDEPSGS